MERRQRQAANGTWERPRYGNNSVRPAPRFSPEEPQYSPAHGEGHPPAFYPDGGAQRTGPWDSRPPYEAGRRGFSSQEESEQRPHRESRVDFTQRGYHEPPQHGAPQGMSQYRPPEGFIHGGTRPGRTQEAPSQPRVRPSNMPRGDDVYGGNALHSPIIPGDGLVRNIPQHGAPEPAQGVMPYNAPSTQQSLGGRPQQMMPPEDSKSTDYIYQSGERLHGGPLQISEERQDPQYRREHPDAYQPDLFHQGGPGSFRGPLPALSQYSGQPPAGFRPDLPHMRSHLQPPIPYQNDGTQPAGFHGGAQAGVQGLNTPPVPDPFMYRAPSPGIQPAPTQNAPQQGHYHLPPVHGNLPNPPYAVYPPAGSVFSGSLEEGNVEIPGFQRHNNHPHHLQDQQPPVVHQDRRQGLDPPIPPRMAGGRNFEHDAPFPQHEVPERHRDLNLLLQHSSPLASQPAPHIEDNFMPTDIEKGSSADKDVFVQWLSSFLSCRRKKPPVKPDAVQTYSIAEARELIYGALRLISQLDSLCQALESSDQAGEPWTRDYEKAANIRVDLEKRLKELEKPGYIQGVKRKLDRVRKKRLRWQRRRQAQEEEEKAATERSAEKETSIDLWRMQCVQKVEEKKRERELKATADRVLGEVRKKQNDAKKMLDVLKALEKLRKLRKEAAGRKGVCPPPSADETFTNHIKRLRTMLHSRSALYDAEEKTLRVILEGEQEEERQREKDKRMKKEKEKTLKKQRELDSILFGDTEPLPSLHPLQPFRQYYLQAEHSVVSLVQIRHEWDQFLVPPDHPDGSNIPRGWVVPTSPSNDIWATALKPSD